MLETLNTAPVQILKVTIYINLHYQDVSHSYVWCLKVASSVEEVYVRILLFLGGP